MKIIKIERVPNGAPIGLPVGISLLTEDRSIPALAQTTDGGIEVKTFRAQGDLSRPTLILRNGGIGDMLFLGYALKKLKRQMPKARVSVYSRDDYSWIYRRFFKLDVPWISYPAPAARIFQAFPSIYDLEHTIEHLAPEAQRKQHITSILAAPLGISIAAEEREPLVDIEARPLQPVLPRGPKYIGVHAQASSWTRSLTGDRLNSLLNAIMERGWVPVMFGKEPKVHLTPLPPGVLWLSRYCEGFEAQVEALREMAGFVGVDSCFIYFAQLLKTPTVGLYASVSAQSRVLNARHDQSIEAVGACSKCYFHHRYGSDEPGGLCQTRRVCPLLQGIRDSEVVECLAEVMK